MVTQLLETDPDAPYPMGRHVNHDPQSLRFPFSARPEAEVEIRSRPAWPRRIPILDQQIGSCTGNTAVGDIGTDSLGHVGLTQVTIDSKVWPCDQALAVHLYSEGTEIDPFEGTYPPDDTGSDGLSVAKVMKGYGLIAEFTWGFNGLQDILARLQTGTVWMGTWWYYSMFYPTPDGFVKIEPNSARAGGHEWLLNGEVNLEEKWVGADNSWGSSFGLDGRFKVSFDTLERLCAEEGDALMTHDIAVINPEPDEDLKDKSGCWSSLLSMFKRTA